MSPSQPEQAARQEIDRLLQDAGWVIQDMDQLNLGAGLGVAEWGWRARDVGAAEQLALPGMDCEDSIPNRDAYGHFGHRVPGPPIEIGV